MRTKFWSGIGVLASIVAGMGAASAADLPMKAPVYKAPPPVILSDWSGFYIGAHGGYGWGDVTFDNFFTNGGSQNLKPAGGIFGGHVGYNWQYGSVVAGLEVDFDGADITGTENTNNVTFKTDELASARARLGYSVLPNLLAYGTAGAGWGHSTLTPTVTGVANGFVNDDTNQFGWVAGVGLEYKVWEHWIVRGEYLHYGFEKSNFSNNFPAIPTSESVDVVRGGLSYKF
jgi:opacity protein-like surface antigen